MAEALLAYQPTLVAGAVLAVLIMAQVLVADAAGIRVRHVPGMPVTDGHASFHFRAVRALGNTNETLGLFVLLVALALALALGASATWVNPLAWAYVAARAGHMAFYYARMGRARGIAFGIGLAVQAALLVVVLAAL